MATWYESGSLGDFGICGSVSEDDTYYQRIQVTQRGKIDRVRVYACAVTDTDQIRLAIYDDDSGPDALRAQTDDYTITSTGYVSLWLNHTVEVEANDYVWVAIQVTGTGANPVDLSNNWDSPPVGGEAYIEESVSWGDGFPDPANAEEIGGDISFYVGARAFFVEAVTMASAKFEISTDGGSTWQNISGYTTAIEEGGGERQIGKVWTAEGRRPIVCEGKDDAREITLVVVYTDDSDGGYQTLRDAMEADGGEILIRWSPAGGNSDDARYTTDTNYGAIKRCELPTGPVSGGQPVVARVTVVTPGVDKDTV